MDELVKACLINIGVESEKLISTYSKIENYILDTIVEIEHVDTDDHTLKSAHIRNLLQLQLSIDSMKMTLLAQREGYQKLETGGGNEVKH